MRGSIIVVIVSLALGCGEHTGGGEDGEVTESGDESTTGEVDEPTACERVLDPSIYPEELVWTPEPVVADESCPASGPSYVVQWPASVLVSGTVDYGGNPGGGTLELIGRTTEGRVETDVSNGSFSAEVLPGRYDVILHPKDTGTDLVASMTVAQDMEITAPLVLPIDVPVVTVSGTMTMDGQLAPDAYAWLLIPNDRYLPDHQLHMIDSSYSVTATPGSYEVRFDSCDPTDRFGPCHVIGHPPLMEPPLGPDQRSVPFTTFEVGSEALQLDLDVPTVTIAGTVSLDGHPMDAHLSFRNGYVSNSVGAPDGVFSERWVAAQYDSVVLYALETTSNLMWAQYYAATLVPELENIDADVNLDLSPTSASILAPWPGQSAFIDPLVSSWLPGIHFDTDWPSVDLLSAGWPVAQEFSVWPGVRAISIEGRVCWPDYDQVWNQGLYAAIMLGEEIEISGEVELETTVVHELAAVHVDLLWGGPGVPTFGALRIVPIARPPEGGGWGGYGSFPGTTLDVHGYLPRGPANVSLDGVPAGVVNIQDGTTVFLRPTLDLLDAALEVDGASVPIYHLEVAPIDVPNQRAPINTVRPAGRYQLLYGHYDTEVDSNDGLPDNHNAVVGCITREG